MAVPIKEFSEDSKLLLAMRVGEVKEWPIWEINDIRPKISYLYYRRKGRWTTRVDKKRHVIIVTRTI